MKKTFVSQPSLNQWFMLISLWWAYERRQRKALHCISIHCLLQCQWTYCVEKTAFIILVSSFVLVAAIWSTSAGWDILNSSSWCMVTCNWNVKELLSWLTGNVFVMAQTEPITFSLFRELITNQGLFSSLTEINPLQSSKQNNAPRNNEKINLF